MNFCSRISGVLKSQAYAIEYLNNKTDIKYNKCIKFNINLYQLLCKNSFKKILI